MGEYYRLVKGSLGYSSYLQQTSKSCPGDLFAASLGVSTGSAIAGAICRIAEALGAGDLEVWV